MPLIQLVSTGDVPRLRGDTRPLLSTLAETLETQPVSRPVFVLLHGLRYDAATPSTDPAASIFSAIPPKGDPRTVSWPRHLGFGRGRAEEGLCIGLSWPARTGLRQAYNRAADAGRSLAHLVDLIRFADPRRKIVVLAHSLGARVALCALPHIRTGRIHRMVFVYGAEIGSEATRLLGTATRPLPDILNVTSRENRIIDRAFATAITGCPWAKTIGGRGAAQPLWTDLPLHDPATLALLRAHGYPISTALRPICHWSGYLRPGVFAVYRDFLNGSGALPLPQLSTLPDQTRSTRRLIRPYQSNLA